MKQQFLDSDVLADVLEHYHVTGRLYCVSNLSAPWAIAMRSIDNAHFHSIEHGAAYVHLGAKRPRPIAAGDLLIITDGKGHVISDSPNSTAVPITPPPKSLRGTVFLEHGGHGAETQLVCGQFAIPDRDGNPLMAVLPRVIHVTADRAGEWLAPMLRLLWHESRNQEPGRNTVVSRLMEIIFVQAVRAWVTELEDGAGGWLGALRDPQIGRSLALIHQSPERDWSMESLARNVGMSRSRFFERFKTLTGEPPLAYLTRWRMHIARRLLLEDATIADVASRVGYSSEAAFSNAFKRAAGQSPTAFRRSREDGEDAA